MRSIFNGTPYNLTAFIISKQHANMFDWEKVYIYSLNRNDVDLFGAELYQSIYNYKRGEFHQLYSNSVIIVLLCKTNAVKVKEVDGRKANKSTSTEF